MISKFKPFQGPNQFVFKDPDLGTDYGPEVSKKALLDRIRVFREQNHLEPIEFLETVLENYWCSLRENVGRCVVTELPRGILPLMRAGVTLLKNYLYDKFASQEVAEKRAKQCAKCPYNDTTVSRTWVDLLALNCVEDRRTAQYDRLGQCSVCRCPLNVKVFFDGKVPKPSREEKEKFDSVKCWQLEIVE